MATAKSLNLDLPYFSRPNGRLQRTNLTITYFNDSRVIREATILLVPERGEGLNPEGSSCRAGAIDEANRDEARGASEHHRIQ